MASLWRIPLLLASTRCVQISLSSPNPPAKADERRKFVNTTSSKQRGIQLKDVLPLITKFYKALMIAINLIEVVVIVASNLPFSRIQHNIFVGIQTDHVRITLSFLLGFLLVISGTMLRIFCYRILGPNFTFELTLRPDHDLITSGPYSVVRHPSYTGGLIFMTGLSVCQMGEGSWWKESGLQELVPGRLFWMVWVGVVAVVEAFLVYRTTVEDEALKGHFGEKWERWAKTTRYRLLPYVY
ncbi:unnamed protein product [Somion occarium]|uniref:Protein-S-isoprenylcysteine O-methyltransferase n=1 Tax=Somion occarium TaxID=3059160 RepID=A0ABP1DS21_9APHY